MGLWGLLAQGIQDTVGWITGAATKTSPIHQTQHQFEVDKHAMSTADQDIENQRMMLNHQMAMDQKNYEHTKEAYEYQKQLQERLFQREDNAVQRRTEDLRAAGINPLLAAGQSANAGSPVGVTAPHHAVTGKAVSMSPKLQAYAMRQEMYNQLHARRLQIAQMASHTALLGEQIKHERSKTRETDAHTEEIKERTAGYSGQRELTQSQIKQIASHIKLNEHTLAKISQETSRITLDTAERRYNFDKARQLGIRSDVNPTLVGELTQALYALMHMREKDLKEKWKNEFLDKNPDLREFFAGMTDEPATIQGLLEAMAERQSERIRRERNMEAARRWNSSGIQWD